MSAAVPDEVPDEADLFARVALSRLCEPGDEAMVELVDRFGAVEVLDHVLHGPSTSDRLRAWRARSEGVDPFRDLDRARRGGARVLVPGGPGWPTALDALGTRRPLLLWARGPLDVDAVSRRSVALVGARAATAYGEHVAAELASDLAEAGWAVVSGGAYGVDAAAHRGALAVEGPTVAVLACGVDETYPRGHSALLERVATCGLVLSELPPGSRPTRSRFLERNRVIAALACGTVVVEAAVRSGARRTAGDALRLMRPLMAVPGPVTSPASAGCHQLVRFSGAVLVTGARDVLDVVGALGNDAVEPDRAPDGPLDRLDPRARAVREALAVRSARPVATVAASAGCTPREALRELSVLAAAGLAEPVGDAGWRLAGPTRGT